MIDQVMLVHSEAKWLHIGCDEVFQIGLCHTCRLKDHDELFLSHGKCCIKFIWLPASFFLGCSSKSCQIRQGQAPSDSNNLGRYAQTIQCRNDQIVQSGQDWSGNNDLDLHRRCVELFSVLILFYNRFLNIRHLSIHTQLPMAQLCRSVSQHLGSQCFQGSLRGNIDCAQRQDALGQQHCVAGCHARTIEHFQTHSRFSTDWMATL